ncbi:hypothetical protein Tco_1530626 [Tanacetum coccineum]
MSHDKAQRENKGYAKRIWHSLQSISRSLYKTYNKHLRTFFKLRNKTEVTHTKGINNDNQSRQFRLSKDYDSCGALGNLLTVSWHKKIQEVLPEESSSTEQPLEQVQNHDESNVFAIERRHSEQPESINDTYVLEKDDSNELTLDETGRALRVAIVVVVIRNTMRYLNVMNARTKKPNVVPISASKPKRKMNKSVATPHKKIVASDTTIQKPKSYFKELYENTNKDGNGG